MKNLKKALGYEYTEKKVFDLKREIVEDVKVKVVVEKKEVEIKKYKKPSLLELKKILKWDN